jgi:hypothetical protein
MEREEEKGEKARVAVNASAGDGTSGDASPRRAEFVPVTAAVGGGKASKGGRCIAGISVSRRRETR